MIQEKTKQEKETITDVKKEEKKKVEVPEKFKKLVEEIEKMSVLDLVEFVKILEEKFGVSAATPMAMTVAPGPTGGEKPAEEEKSSFNVELVAAGTQKIAVIKVLREITGKGLKDAKDMTEKTPAIVKENVPKKEAEEIKKKLEGAGAKVNLK